MPEPPAAAHEREARVFTAALIGAEPSARVVAHYARGQAALALTPRPGFDALLVRVARAGRPWTRIADAYARLCAPRATLRRKLTLLLAILESTAPTDAAFAPLPGAPATIVLRLTVTGAGAALCAVAGLILLGPLHLASRLAGRV